MIFERSLEKQYYEYFRNKIENNLFPENWDLFITMIRNQLHYNGEINQIERNILWQAGCSFKTGCTLIEQKRIENSDLSTSVIESGAIQLIIYGTFMQLKEWVKKLRVEHKDIGLIGRIKKYISENNKLNELRNAIAHSGDNNNNTYFILSSRQSIIFKTKKTNEELTICIYEVLFVSLLLWIVFSEWATNKI